MRAARSGLLKKKQSTTNASIQAESTDCSESMLEVAEEYQKVGEREIKTFLSNPDAPILLSEDLNHAIVALKIARELYEQAEKKDKAEVAQELLESVAEKFLSKGRGFIEQQLKKISTAEPVSRQEIEKGIIALTYAAEVYEVIASWADAIFAWSMIKAVPSDDVVKNNAQAKIAHRQAKLQGAGATAAGAGPRFFPRPPAKPSSVSRLGASKTSP